MDDGTHPHNLTFDKWTYDTSSRHFYGDIIFDKNNKSNTYYGIAKYTYDLKFSEDFLEIEQGERREYDKDDTLIATFPHQNANGLKSYMYVIDHEIKPKIFNLTCKVLREKDSLNNVDDIIANYKMPTTKKSEEEEEEEGGHHAHDEENGEKLQIVRLQNETSFQFIMNEEMLFTKVNNY